METYCVGKEIFLNVSLSEFEKVVSAKYVNFTTYTNRFPNNCSVVKCKQTGKIKFNSGVSEIFGSH